MSIYTGLQASLSGMRASSKRMHASAHNVANIHTDDFKGLRVVNTPAAVEGSGVTTQVELSSHPGPFTLDEYGELSQRSNVDLADEAIQRIQASRAYEANLVVVQALSDMDSVLTDNTSD